MYSAERYSRAKRFTADDRPSNHFMKVVVRPLV